jgi:hypothetical protein
MKAMRVALVLGLTSLFLLTPSTPALAHYSCQHAAGVPFVQNGLYKVNMAILCDRNHALYYWIGATLQKFNTNTGNWDNFHSWNSYNNCPGTRGCGKTFTRSIPSCGSYRTKGWANATNANGGTVHYGTDISPSDNPCT